MQKFNRIFVIVLDSLGIGEMKDSARFGDIGVNTLQHVSQSVDSFQIPNLQKLGIANLLPLAHVDPMEQPPAYYTKLNERSQGKDTMTGHWEMMGLHIQAPFKTFTEHGFPPELIRELETRTGRKVLGNRSDSGIGIIDEFGEEQLVTGDMIIYTSADSVLQICGHEEAFGVEELYRCCEIAREITMKDEWKVGRVIARPFVGKKAGEFERTSNRHDYALKPFGPTTLTALKEADLDVIAIGKIRDIFDGEGITKALRSKTSVHGMEQTIQTAQEEFHGLCFVNLVDFDALWGHRRDPVGYAKEVEKFDEKLGTLMEALKEEDLLIVTADHGNDPTYKGSDHTREKVPFLAYAKSLSGNGPLPEMDTFAVIGATIVENFGVEKPKGTIGESILHLLK
ncbi:MAG: phosphopentomutase [Lachnospiraceae bacterium]|nr:phosphopentomutase [Lachnospiraceae bacterium]